MTESPQNPDSELMLKITACQGKIFALAISMLGDHEAAADIQQETNLVIWGKAEEAKQVGNFSAWALKIAYFQIKNFRRKQQRSMLLFDSDVMELLAEDATEMVSSMDDRLNALQNCMKCLPEQHRQLLEERYHHGLSVKDIARRVSRSANNIGVMLFRIRTQLHNCISQRLRGDKA
ncbi:MAG: sigma-70 family RNA polymerase sigma factor [Phycisphaeraceae bacterium]|nr:sigma-70 family RNA polymerase sigma factor [Phycisphaeraceae bacterium]